MKRLPTERDVLEAIHRRYVTAYTDPEASKGRQHKHMIGIDLNVVADDLGADPAVIRSILFYHLNRKYGFHDAYEKMDVRLFIDHVYAYEEPAVDFPYLSAILAGLREEHTTNETNLRMARLAVWAAWGSVVATVIAALISIVPTVIAALEG